MRTSAVVATVVMLLSAPIARAEPATPDPVDACNATLAGVATVLPGADAPSRCENGRWQSLSTPQPPADRWLSFGPPLILRGQGMRNPNLLAGNWTATPIEEASRCRAQQQNVVEPGVLSAPAISAGEPGRALEFSVSTRLFTAELTGYCVWTRT